MHYVKMERRRQVVDKCHLISVPCALTMRRNWNCPRRSLATRTFSNCATTPFKCTLQVFLSVPHLPSIRYEGECRCQSAGYGTALNSQWLIVAISNALERSAMSSYQHSTTCI